MTLPIRIRPGAGDQSGTKYRTFCCYGNTRCGKTQFAATFPNPVFISDMSERGWVTLEGCVRDAVQRLELEEAVKRQPRVVKVFDETRVVPVRARKPRRPPA